MAGKTWTMVDDELHQSDGVIEIEVEVPSLYQVKPFLHKQMTGIVHLHWRFANRSCNQITGYTR